VELNAGEEACEGDAGVEVHVCHLQYTAGGLPRCVVSVTGCGLEGKRSTARGCHMSQVIYWDPDVSLSEQH